MVGAVLSLVTPTIRNSITSLIPHEVGKYELLCARACYPCFGEQQRVYVTYRRCRRVAMQT
jgi:hypothetical protein